MEFVVTYIETYSHHCYGEDEGEAEREEVCLMNRKEIAGLVSKGIPKGFKYEVFEEKDYFYYECYRPDLLA
jgi:hypothetical protein